MEDGLLILRHVHVENANTIAGLTWGFPAITNFLGFVHALSRKLPPELELEPNGCGVVCHYHEIQAYQPRGWGDYIFSLTRNPLTSKGESPSFTEEGRMHMTVSLLIPIEGDLDNDEVREETEKIIKQLALSQHLAGGSIINIGSVELEEPPEDQEGLEIFSRKLLRSLLPGFALIQRSELLAEHIDYCRAQEPEAEPLDAWLDFVALKYQAEPAEQNEENKAEQASWHSIPKPGKGWLVPLSIGYRGISDLYQPGEVARTRDNTTPFRFVEAVYTIGEWVSPHRLQDLQDMIWHYYSEPESGWYLCTNTNHFHSKENKIIGENYGSQDRISSSI